MKKFIAIMMALVMVFCLATPAQAVTPELDVPDMPEIPDISDDIDFGIDFGNIIDDWFNENPIPPLVPTEPVEVPTEPAEPEETEPQFDFYTELDMDTPGVRSMINWLREFFWWTH